MAYIFNKNIMCTEIVDFDKLIISNKSRFIANNIIQNTIKNNGTILYTLEVPHTEYINRLMGCIGPTFTKSYIEEKIENFNKLPHLDSRKIIIIDTLPAVNTAAVHALRDATVNNGMVLISQQPHQNLFDAPPMLFHNYLDHKNPTIPTKTPRQLLHEIGIITPIQLKNEYMLIKSKKSKLSKKYRDIINEVYEDMTNIDKPQ